MHYVLFWNAFIVLHFHKQLKTGSICILKPGPWICLVFKNLPLSFSPLLTRTQHTKRIANMLPLSCHPEPLWVRGTGSSVCISCHPILWQKSLLNPKESDQSKKWFYSNRCRKYWEFCYLKLLKDKKWIFSETRCSLWSCMDGIIASFPKVIPFRGFSFDNGWFNRKKTFHFFPSLTINILTNCPWNTFGEVHSGCCWSHKYWVRRTGLCPENPEWSQATASAYF